MTCQIAYQRIKKFQENQLVSQSLQCAVLWEDKLSQEHFMVGWLIVHMIALVLFRIVSLVTTIVIMTSFFTGASSYDTSALIVGGSLFIGFLVALNWLGYYFWNIVRSALIEIEQEDGLWYALEFQLCNYIFR